MTRAIAESSPPEHARPESWPQPLRLELAEVERADDEGIWLRCGRDSVRAERAAGCLSAPRSGDRVAVAVTAGERFVTEVISQAEADEGVTLHSTRRLSIRSDEQVTLRAPGVDVVADDAARLTSRRLSIAAGEGSVAMRALSVVAREVDARGERLCYALRRIDGVIGSLRQRLRSCFRTVEDLDSLRAGTIDQQAKGMARIHAGDVVGTADRLVKLDGEQVHIG